MEAFSKCLVTLVNQQIGHEQWKLVGNVLSTSESELAMGLLPSNVFCDTRNLSWVFILIERIATSCTYNDLI